MAVKPRFEAARRALSRQIVAHPAHRLKVVAVVSTEAVDVVVAPKYPAVRVVVELRSPSCCQFHSKYARRYFGSGTGTGGSRLAKRSSSGIQRS